MRLSTSITFQSSPTTLVGSGPNSPTPATPGGSISRNESIIGQLHTQRKFCGGNGADLGGWPSETNAAGLDAARCPRRQLPAGPRTTPQINASEGYQTERGAVAVIEYLIATKQSEAGRLGCRRTFEAELATANLLPAVQRSRHARVGNWAPAEVRRCSGILVAAWRFLLAQCW
jgi:hypothetical protein